MGSSGPSDTHLLPDGYARLVRSLLSKESDGPISDHRFAQIALATGAITPAQLDECLREQARLLGMGVAARLGQILLERGWLSTSRFNELVEQVRLPENEGEPSEAPRKTLGKYVLTKEIARGGMGIIYEAEDSELHRRVAVKVLQPDKTTPPIVARFHREAEIAAQLRHPNIVQIYDVGVGADGSGPPLHYIAMEYVEGRTLADLIHDAAVERSHLLRILEEAARAVAHAHARGVLHRDLKPTNVSVEPEGRVVLLDFGLAHAEGFEVRLTRSMEVLGTPLYMAPEQARGNTRDIDERTDVYGLGVMLYEILTGHSPFEVRAPAEMFRRIETGDFVLPSRRGRPVPRDLEAICLRAMATERVRRYTSALELAEDLRRYRLGESVQAKPENWTHRFRRRFGRRKLSWAIATAGILLGAVLLTPWKRNAPSTAAPQSMLDALRDLAALRLGAAIERRRDGDLPGMRAQLGKLEEDCRRLIREIPQSPEPNYLLGRMYRVLMMDAEALEQHNEALRKDPRYAPALYERILLATNVFSRRMSVSRDEYRHEAGLELARQGGGTVMPGAPLTRLSSPRVLQMDEKTALSYDRLEEDLDSFLSLPDSRGVREAQISCAAGLQALFHGNIDEARGRLTQALEQDPRMVEPYEILAELASERLRYQEAVDWWSKGLAVDRGYVPFWEGRGVARANLIVSRQPREMVNPYAEALADLQTAVCLDQSRAQGWLGFGIVWVRLEILLADNGLDPSGACHEALECLRQAKMRDSTDALPYAWSGCAWLNRGRSMREPKGNPTVFYHAALKELQEALVRASKLPQAWEWSGTTHLYLALSRISENEDPEAEFKESSGCYDVAVTLSPGAAQLRMLRGNVLLHWALFRAAHEWDPAKMYRDAIQEFTVVIGACPRSFDVWKYRGLAYHNLAVQKKRRNEDAREEARRALEDFAKAEEFHMELGPDERRAIAACNSYLQSHP